jgi:predicted aconitase with swiveling domain
MQPRILKGRIIVEGKCRGEALVSARPISFLGGIDPADGKIIEKKHDLSGLFIKDRILCFPHGHGSLSARALAPMIGCLKTAFRG